MTEICNRVNSSIFIEIYDFAIITGNNGRYWWEIAAYRSRDLVHVNAFPISHKRPTAQIFL